MSAPKRSGRYIPEDERGTVHVNGRIPRAVRDSLAVLAAQQGKTQGRVIRELIEAYVAAQTARE